MAFKRLASPNFTIRLSEGLNTHYDSAMIKDNQIVSSTRMYPEKSILRTDKGTELFGVDLPYKDVLNGIGVHAHPESPRIIIAADGTSYIDNDGAGGSWGVINAGWDYDSPVSIVGQYGITYLANGIDRTIKYQGGTTASVLLEGFEDYTQWTKVTGDPEAYLTLANEAVSKREGTYALKVSYNWNQGSTSIGDGVTKTLAAAVDLTEAKSLTIWFRYKDVSVANGVGVAQLILTDVNDANAATFTIVNTTTSNLTSDAERWKRYTFDLVSVPDASLLAVKKITILSLVNESPSDFDFYIDAIYYQTGSYITTLPDLPRPEDSILTIAPYPIDNVIDDCESATNWAAVNSGTVVASTTYTHNGTYSLKCTTPGAVKNEGMGRTLTNTIDLSKCDYISYWIYATDQGDAINFQMSEVSNYATGLSHALPITAEMQFKWTQVLVDLTSYPPADRDAIKYIRFVTGPTVATEFYIDRLVYTGNLAGSYTYAVSFYDSTTGNEGPIGAFKSVESVEPNEETGALPQRTFAIPSTTVYLPEGADRVKLYRTISNSQDEFYLIATLTPSSNLISYTDTTPDTLLTEDLRLQVWPGIIPRAKWLIPYNERMLHVGGSYIMARNENINGNQTGTTQYTPNITASVDLAVKAVEFKVKVGTTGEVIAALQRTTKGGSTWVTKATGSITTTFLVDNWYRIELNVANTSDILLSAIYDWRIMFTLPNSTIALYKAWVSSGDYVAYRLLGDSSNIVWVSNYLEPTKVPPYDKALKDMGGTAGGFFQMEPNDQDTINAWARHGSDIIFFKKNAAFVFTGTDMSDFAYARLFENMGCIASGTAVDCDGWLVWMAQDRQIYKWQSGSFPQQLSLPIAEDLDAITKAQAVYANALYKDRKYYLFIPTASTGSRSYVYDFDEDKWYQSYNGSVYFTLPKGFDTDAISYSLVDEGETDSTVYCKVLKMYEINATDEGSAFTFTARSKDYELLEYDNNPATIYRLRGYRILLDDGDTAGTITVNWYVDRGTTPTRTYTETLTGESGWYYIERYPHRDIVGQSISVEITGTHTDVLKINRIELSLQKVR